MIARVGAEVSFGKAATLLADLAGIAVTAKTAERSSEASGAASIIALRCQHASGRWDELWPASTPPAGLRAAI